MGKYKVCPNCGKHNDPGAIECEVCEEDLTTEMIVDDKLQNNNVQIENKQIAKENIQLVKICPECGEKNSPISKECSNCDEDLTFVVPTQDYMKKEQEEKVITLVSCNDDYRFKLETGVNLIGREHLMSDYLNEKSYVSRKHAEIIVSEKNIQIINYGVNGTFINNKRINDNSLVILSCGDKIYFGDDANNDVFCKEAAYFELVCEE